MYDDNSISIVLYSISCYCGEQLEKRFETNFAVELK